MTTLSFYSVDPSQSRSGGYRAAAAVRAARSWWRSPRKRYIGLSATAHSGLAHAVGADLSRHGRRRRLILLIVAYPGTRHRHRALTADRPVRSPRPGRLFSARPLTLVLPMTAARSFASDRGRLDGGRAAGCRDHACWVHCLQRVPVGCPCGPLRQQSLQPALRRRAGRARL